MSQVRVREHRQRLREQGLRPVQLWIPDVRLPSYAATLADQANRVAASDQSSEIMSFVDAHTVEYWDRD